MWDANPYALLAWAVHWTRLRRWKRTGPGR